MNSQTFLSGMLDRIQLIFIDIDVGSTKENACIMAAIYSLHLKCNVAFNFSGKETRINYNDLVTFIIAD